MEINIHNHYKIQIRDNENNLVREVEAYNTAYSASYLSYGYISQLELVGSGRTRYIEPYPENPEDITTYWYRNGQPYKNNEQFISGYRATVFFPETGSSGSFSGIKMYASGGLISEANIKDIEGDPIILNYKGTERIVIYAFIYFIVDMKDKDEETNHFKNYPITYFQPCNSVLCGCCGTDKELLITGERLNHNGDVVTDGFLPYPKNRSIAFTKSPIPRLDEDGYLLGGINNFDNLKEREGRVGEQNYKNELVSNIKGLVRAIVLPQIGLIDLNDSRAKYGGPLNEGILKGSRVHGQEICYVPKEYIASGAPVCPISLDRSPFYHAPTITVRRHRNNGAYVVDKEIPLNESFFSDLVDDVRLQKCMSFSQHVPLTDYYCGAENTIPCSAGGFANKGFEHYGYDIIYSGEKVNDNGEKEFVEYIAASYLVIGECLYEDSLGQRHKITFPCKLEYSFNGNDFFTAAETNSNTEPYEKIYFTQGTISAPIWRLTSSQGGHTLYLCNSTTHGDKNIAEIAGLKESGYDPLFIFVGYDRNESVASIEGADTQKTEASLIKAEQCTGNFMYGDTMACGDFETTVPYLYHEDDCIYFSGSLKWGKE